MIMPHKSPRFAGHRKSPKALQHGLDDSPERRLSRLISNSIDERRFDGRRHIGSKDRRAAFGHEPPFRTTFGFR